MCVDIFFFEVFDTPAFNPFIGKPLIFFNHFVISIIKWSRFDVVNLFCGTILYSGVVLRIVVIVQMKLICIM